MIQQVIDISTKNSIELIQDPYGNYIMQEIFETFIQDTIEPILKTINGHIVKLSLLKFSSNVIEKCLEKANKETRKEIIREIISSGRLLELMKSNYGNYVVQKALTLSNEETRKELEVSIKKKINSLLDKKLKSKWCQILKKLHSNQ